MTENIDKFTEMEYMVIDELKEVYDPVIMTEEEIHTEFVRISNAIGVEVFEVKAICERWMREELLTSIEQTNRHFSSDSDENSYK
jgi:hypothetical protein|tara:strand:- start:462 stop:716 length:255 start_codon:yes stop_codon:yes gene_type:complete